MSNTHKTSIPEGYLKDASGRLVPVTMIKEIDLERDRLVHEIVEKARAHSAALTAFKKQAHGDIAAFVELSAEKYQVKVGGKKGNVTLTSFDGKFRILRAVQERITFDERLTAAKELVHSCLSRWSEGSRPELQVIVNQAFEVDRAGKVSTAKVLSLQRYQINDPEWQRAMQAISDSVQEMDSKSYIRVYERVGDTDEYELLPLDVAGV